VLLLAYAPDADNLAVAVATVTKTSTPGLHRTFSHSLFTVVVVIAVFCLVNLATKKRAGTTWGLD
jgi:membrane-bound metal-dependent hydrolase YbcI (DUF457 family)